MSFNKKHSEPKHIISSRDFTRPFLEELFTRARAPFPRRSPLKNRVVASLFYEPSTRTRLSFESAALRLGGGVLSTENAREFSSAAKGETIEDTIRVLGTYADVIVLRHHERGSAARAASVSLVPVINAGDGDGEHPTQALLDAYSIEQELGSIDNTVIACCGDLRYGRTVHSLVYLLSLYKNIRFIFVAPEELRIPDSILKYLAERNIPYREQDSLVRTMREADVVYQTRIQRERLPNERLYARVKNNTRLTRELLDSVPGTKPIILHPLPRLDELPTAIDTDRRAAYFRQAAYGLAVRAALLRYLVA